MEGVAAHITAAAPKGPRYDPALTKQQRASIENGIWLCSNCAGLIDRDIAGHSVDLLRQWKRDAEKRAFERLGTPQPQKDDAIRAVTAALTGAVHLDYALQAPRAVSAGVSQALEALDPRFGVEVSHAKGHTRFAITQRDPSARVKFRIAGNQRHAQLLQKFVDFGVPATLSDVSIRTDGSPLFQRLFENSDSMSFSRASSGRLTMRIIIETKDGKEQRFDDATTAFHWGQKGITFTSNPHDGLLKIVLVVRATPATAVEEFSIQLVPSQWVGIDIRQLPWTNKLRYYAENIAAARFLRVEIENDGETVVRARIAAGLRPQAETLLRNIDLIGKLKSVCRAFDFDLKLTHSRFSNEEVAEILEIGTLLEFDETVIMETHFTPKEPETVLELKNLSERDDLTTVRLPFDAGLKFQGVATPVRDIVFVLDNVCVKPEKESVFAVGKPVKIEVRGTRNTRVTIEPAPA